MARGSKELDQKSECPPRDSPKVRKGLLRDKESRLRLLAERQNHRCQPFLLREKRDVRFRCASLSFAVACGA